MSNDAMRNPTATALRIVVSLAVSCLALALIFGLVARGSEGISHTQLLGALRGVGVAGFGLYLLAQVLQALFRAWRYALLLRAGGEPEVPGLLHLYLVTLARSMFVDMLPARVGELSYVGMLNRGYRVSGEGCVSSLTISVFFDLLALWLVAMAAVLAPVLGSAGRLQLLSSLAVLTVAIPAGWIVLFHGTDWLGRRTRSRLDRLRSSAMFRGAWGFLDRLLTAFVRVRGSGALPAAIGLSAAVRVCKYAGLYILFRNVARAGWPALASAPAWAVIITLIAAEGAASLPVPAFMSFGTYEAGGLLTLTALGFSAADAAAVLVSMHVCSQMIDYALGGLGVAVFGLLAGRRRETRRARPARRRAAMAAAAGLFVLGSLAFFGLQYRAFRKLGSVEPPAAGEGADAEPALRAEAAAGIRGLRGFVVWSSNRFGKHEIVKLTLPGMKLERLTDNAYVDTYPRLSPDGTKIVFCRSQLPWVSQRDHLPWDTYVLDLATGRERRVARDAYVPTWSEDGTRVFFERRACQVVEHELDTGRERVLFESGKAQVPEGVLLETPEFNGRAGELAVTYRRAQRATMVIGLDGSARRVGGGCQLSWSPDRSFLFFVDGGGRGKNAIWRFDPGTGGKALWLDLPGPYSHEYFPRLSRDGRWLVVGAAAEGHEHDRADYEIFLWPVGAPAESAARLTFHTGNDSWPDIWTE